MKSGTRIPGSSGSPGEPARDGARAPETPLDPANGEEHGRALLERLRRISEHSPGRDRYQVLEEIGRGGMGRVLRVWDEDLERELALKEIQLAAAQPESSENAAHRERLLARFLFEARITGQLHHPSIVPVHEIGLDQRGALYFTMPLVRGKNLQQVFNLARLEKKDWNLHRALGVLVQVAQTVAYAHSRGVIHRDLTPSNVMVGPFGEVFVMDWGLALLKGRAERGAIVGTPAYMPPEQAFGSSAEVDERSDVYSLGAMLYELLCGRMPHAKTAEEGFSSPETPRSMLELAQGSPRPVLELEHDLPPELVAICAKAMAQQPDQRYGSAGELAADLQAWLERRVVSAHATGRWARLKKWRERNARLCLALEALLLLATISAGVVLALQRSKLFAIAAERAEVARKDYATRLKAAELSLEQGGWGEATGLLAGCPVELRDWAWRHLTLRADSSLRQLAGHDYDVLAVAFRPDGSRLATGSGDHTIGLWDPDQGVLVARLEGHADGVSAVSFSPDGALLASGSRDHSIRLWDAASGAFSRQLGEHAERVTCIAFAPDGRALLSGSVDGSLRLWQLDGSLGWQRAPSASGSGADAVTSIAWGEERVALVGSSSGRLARLDISDGATLSEAFMGSTVQALAHHPRDAIVAAATLDEGVLLLDGNTLARIRRLEDVVGNVRSLVWADAGARLIMGLTDGSIRIWSPPESEIAVLHGHGEAVLALASDPHSGRFVSGSGDATARLWSVDGTATRTLALGEDVELRQPSLHLAPDFVAGSRKDGSSFVRFLDGGAPNVRLEGDAPGSKVCVRADGVVVAVAGWDGSIRIHRTSDGSLVRSLAGPFAEQIELRFDATGKRLLARGVDSILRVWDVEEACVLLELPVPGNEESGLAFSPDGKHLLVAWADGGIRIHDARNGSLLATLEGEDEQASALVFTPDGRTLFSGSKRGTIQVWDFERRQPIARMHGHKRHVSSMAFTTGGERLFSASHDGTVRIWDPLRGELLMTLRCGVFPVTDVAFDPEQDRLVAVDAKHRVHVWSTRAAE